MQQFFFSSCSSLFLSQSYSNSSSHSSSSHLFFPFLSCSSELYFLTRCKLIGRKLRFQYFGRTVIYWIQAMATQVVDSRCFGFVFFSFCACVCVYCNTRACKKLAEELAGTVNWVMSSWPVILCSHSSKFHCQELAARIAFREASWEPDRSLGQLCFASPW